MSCGFSDFWLLPAMPGWPHLHFLNGPFPKDFTINMQKCGLAREKMIYILILYIYIWRLVQVVYI